MEALHCRVQTWLWVSCGDPGDERRTEMAARPQPPALSPPCGAEPRPLPSVLGNSLAATAGPCGGAELQGKLTPSSPDSHAGPPLPSAPPQVGPEGPSLPPPRLLERFLFLSIYRLNLKKKMNNKTFPSSSPSIPEGGGRGGHSLSAQLCPHCRGLLAMRRAPQTPQCHHIHFVPRVPPLLPPPPLN